MDPRTMWAILKQYLSRVPNALRERERPDGNKVIECVYTPHSLRATAATILLDSGVDIMEVKELLGHHHPDLRQAAACRPRRCVAQNAAVKMTWRRSRYLFGARMSEAVLILGKLFHQRRGWSHYALMPMAPFHHVN